MTEKQEDAFYNFLDKRTEPFTLNEILTALKAGGFRRPTVLQNEITNVLSSRRVAFQLENGLYLSRCGCFSGASFVISPTRLELLNGILIPGHRCVPFANQFVLPQDYKFFWNKKAIKWTTTEGAPDEFYPFFSIYGEEYAPQYIARDNPENEMAFNAEPGEDPYEVSIKTLDMRSVYRESSFVPGDRFLVRVTNWKNCEYSLQRVSKDEWNQRDLDDWVKAAEEGFLKSFEILGSGVSTEEQAAWAYFSGGKRMLNVPAYSLEDFLYNTTDKIDIVPFGLESRFWYAGKEIPDYKQLEGIKTQADETPIEKVLFSHNIPISEFVVQSYIRDALFRGDTNPTSIAKRIAPAESGLNIRNFDFIAAYICDALEDFENVYSIFTDQKIGPVRQQAAELHTEVIKFAAGLKKGGIDSSILPKHTFIVLSQIQIFASNVLEEIDMFETPKQEELNAIENSMESMIDFFDEIRELIDNSRKNFRLNNITLLNENNYDQASWRIIQISIGGTDIWRRVSVPVSMTLDNIRRLITSVFNWSKKLPYKWLLEYAAIKEFFDTDGCVKDNLKIADLATRCVREITYEYGDWSVKIIITTGGASGENKIRCIAGEGCAPPENVEGPLRFRRFVSALNRPNKEEQETARAELGASFDPKNFSIEECNKKLIAIFGD